MGHLTLLFDVSRVGGGGVDGGGWSGWRWLESVTPVNGELDVNRLGTSRLEVDEVGVGGVGEVGGRWSQFPVVVRLTYRGFLLGFGVMTPETG